MNWQRFVLAVLISGVASSITDMIFMGMLFRNKYKEAAEMFRLQEGQSTGSSILASAVIGLVGSGAFIYLCMWTGALTVPHAELRMAAIVWLAAPVPVILSNVVWTKLHPLLGLSHSLGWLARFVISSLVAVKLLH
jgi:hypothetical protein